MNHIRDKLPDMKARLNTLMGQTQQELNALGDTSFLGDQHQVGFCDRQRTSKLNLSNVFIITGRPDPTSHDSIRS